MSRIRYNFIDSILASFLVKYNIKYYPVDILDIFKQIPNCSIATYSESALRASISIQEFTNIVSSEDSFVTSTNDGYLIIYNDLKSEQRIRWSLAHELGHIALGHLNLSTEIRDKQYNFLEGEANRFASLLLAHPLILHKLHIRNFRDIIKISNISSKAAFYRYKEYWKYKKRNYKIYYSNIILNQFENFIKFRVCCTCNYNLIEHSWKFCPICKNKQFTLLNKGDIEMHYKEEIKVDTNGKALICPICENEDLKLGEFCHICGVNVVNKCERETLDINTEKGCGSILPGNARYCPKCGNESTFYKNGLLKDWKTNKTFKQHNSSYSTNETFKQSNSSYITDDDIPF